MGGGLGNDMITVTDAAKNQIIKVLSEEAQSTLRIFVQGGGCAGLNYGFTYCDDFEEGEDFLVDINDDYKMAIDGASYQYVDGATIDYETTMMGSNFTFKNPNATATCGCGSSFAI